MKDTCVSPVYRSRMAMWKYEYSISMKSNSRRFVRRNVNRSGRRKARHDLREHLGLTLTLDWRASAHPPVDVLGKGYGSTCSSYLVHETPQDLDLIIDLDEHQHIDDEDPYGMWDDYEDQWGYDCMATTVRDVDSHDVTLNEPIALHGSMS